MISAFTLSIRFCGLSAIKRLSRYREALIQRLPTKARTSCSALPESGAYDGTFTPRPYDYHEFNVEDFATGFMRLEGGMSVNFKFSWAINLPTTNLDMVICGDKGGLSVNGESLYKNIGRYQTECKMKWFDNGQYKGVPFEQHRYMYRNILNTLAGKEEYLD